MSRDEKKAIKRRTADASRLDNFNDIGDIGEFEELAELSKGISKGSSKKDQSDGFDFEGGGEGKKRGMGSSSEDMAKALQRAVNAFQIGVFCLLRFITCSFCFVDIQFL